MKQDEFAFHSAMCLPALGLVALASYGLQRKQERRNTEDGESAASGLRSEGDPNAALSALPTGRRAGEERSLKQTTNRGRRAAVQTGQEGLPKTSGGWRGRYKRKSPEQLARGSPLIKIRIRARIPKTSKVEVHRAQLGQVEPRHRPRRPPYEKPSCISRRRGERSARLRTRTPAAGFRSRKPDSRILF